MFASPAHFRKAGFSVLPRVHRGLMVASHPSIRKYLFKKFKNGVSSEAQLKNYTQRIKGAEALSKFIGIHQLKHIVVPKKWLYALPKKFNSKSGERAYILIVEEMNICSGGKNPKGEVAQKYHQIDEEVLRELCLVVYHFRGLDSMLHNMPFTRSNQITFIDTERWEREREGYLRQVMPFLSQERQHDAREVFKELQGL